MRDIPFSSVKKKWFRCAHLLKKMKRAKEPIDTIFRLHSTQFGTDRSKETEKGRARVRWKRNHRWRKVWKIVLIKKVINKLARTHTQTNIQMDRAKADWMGLKPKGIWRLYFCFVCSFVYTVFATLCFALFFPSSSFNIKISNFCNIVNKAQQKRTQANSKNIMNSEHAYIHRSHKTVQCHMAFALLWHNSRRGLTWWTRQHLTLSSSALS